VTGRASGLGEASVWLFPQVGARIVGGDVAKDRGRALAPELGEGVVSWRCDLAREGEVEALVREIASPLGRLEVLSHHAGIGDPPISVLDLAVKEFNRILGVDLRGLLLGIRHAGRVRKARGRGSLMHSASLSPHVAGFSPYAPTAAKAAGVPLPWLVALASGEDGIRVHPISRGRVFSRSYWGGAPEKEREPLRRSFAEGTAASHPLHRMGLPIGVCGVARRLARDGSSDVKAEGSVVDGGSTGGVRSSTPWLGLVDPGQPILA